MNKYLFIHISLLLIYLYKFIYAALITNANWMEFSTWKGEFRRQIVIDHFLKTGDRLRSATNMRRMSLPNFVQQLPISIVVSQHIIIVIVVIIIVVVVVIIIDKVPIKLWQSDQCRPCPKSLPISLPSDTDIPRHVWLRRDKERGGERAFQVPGAGVFPFPSVSFTAEE